MDSKRAWTVAVGTALLATTVSTQVAPGQSVISMDDGSFSSVERPILRVDTQVSPPTEVPYVSTFGTTNPSGFGAGVIDPITGEFVAGVGTYNLFVSGPFVGRIYRMRLSGQGLKSSSLMAQSIFTTSIPAAPKGIEDLVIDRDGNVIACNTWAVFEVKRAGRGIKRGAGRCQPTVAENSLAFVGLAYDERRHRLYALPSTSYCQLAGLTNGIIAYDLGEGLSGCWSVVDLCPHYPPTGVTWLTGLDFDGSRRLFISSLDPNGQSVVEFDLVTRTFRDLPGAPLFGIDAVTYDRRTGVLHLVEFSASGSTPPLRYVLLDPDTGTSQTWTLTSIPNQQEPRHIALNDYRDITTVFPRTPSASKPFTLEAAAHGEIDDPAEVYVTAVDGVPTYLSLGTGTCDAQGILAIEARKIPAGAFPAGTRLTFTSRRIDASGTGEVVPGNVVEVVLRP